jgi:hypothetical protein
MTLRELTENTKLSLGLSISIIGGACFLIAAAIHIQTRVAADILIDVREKQEACLIKIERVEQALAEIQGELFQLTRTRARR